MYFFPAKALGGKKNCLAFQENTAQHCEEQCPKKQALQESN